MYIILSLFKPIHNITLWFFKVKFIIMIIPTSRAVKLFSFSGILNKILYSHVSVYSAGVILLPSITLRMHLETLQIMETPKVYFLQAPNFLLNTHFSSISLDKALSTRIQGSNSLPARKFEIRSRLSATSILPFLMLSTE
jgi:hypothetical protein